MDRNRLITVLIIMTMLFLGAYAVTQDECSSSSAEPDVQVDVPTDTRTANGPQKAQIYLKSGGGLSPKAPESNAQPDRVEVPDGYVPMGPLGKIGSVEERYVGTWMSDKVTGHMVVTGKATFLIWLWDDHSHTGDFNMTLFKNDDPNNLIAHAHFDDVRINDPPQPHEMKVDLAMNDLALSPDDTLSLRIDASVNGGCYIMIDSPQYDTGVVLETEALEIVQVRSTSTGFEMDFSEKFGVDAIDLEYYAEVDGVPLSEQEKVMKTITPGANSINVEWDYFLEKGEEYELVVGVCYGGEKSSNVTYGPVSVTGQEKGDGGGSSHEEDGGDGSGGGGDEEEPEMGDGEDEGGGDVADDGTDEEPDTGGSGQDGNEDEGTYKAEDKDTEDTPGFGAVVLAAAVGASALIAGLRRTRRRE